MNERVRRYNMNDFYVALENIHKPYMQARVNNLVIETIIKGSEEENFDYVEEALKMAWKDFKLFPYLKDNQILEVLHHYDVWNEFVSKAVFSPESLLQLQTVIMQTEKSNGLSLSYNGEYSSSEIANRLEELGNFFSGEKGKFKIELTITELEN
ncbi:hypothetical protein MZM54_00020 [[Brevibacterium] frigoritolerans]|nr:hypothetical protein [Peribacillus frigoritolerans]